MKQHKNIEPELIGHGAQAKCWKIFDEKNNRFVVVKQRLAKKYRHPKLDIRINTARVKSQAKILEKVLKNEIDVPKVIQIVTQQNKIEMQYIQGQKLKDYINQNQSQAQKVLKKLAHIINKLHSTGIIHGDLTTSNMIFKQQKIYLLDFGLGSLAGSTEDKAVDLYLFQRAFVATHPKLEDRFKIFLQEYGDKAVLDRLQQVRQRGRKKVAFG